MIVIFTSLIKVIELVRHERLIRYEVSFSSMTKVGTAGRIQAKDVWRDTKIDRIGKVST